MPRLFDKRRVSSVSVGRAVFHASVAAAKIWGNDEILMKYLGASEIQETVVHFHREVTLEFLGGRTALVAMKALKPKDPDDKHLDWRTDAVVLTEPMRTICCSEAPHRHRVAGVSFYGGYGQPTNEIKVYYWRPASGVEYAYKADPTPVYV